MTRCGGANIVEAWLALYQEEKNFSDISNLIIMNSTGDGLHWVESFFSGELDVNVDGLYRLLGTYDLKELLGDEWGGYAELLLDSLRETYGIDITLDTAERIYGKIKDSVIAPLLREYYGSCGMNLSLLKNNFYEAVDFIYPTQELKDEYAGVISDATLVHEKAIARDDELLKEAQDAGVYVGIVCEYGFQTTPLSEDGGLIGDSTSTVKAQSYGATTSTVTGTLSDEYIASREAEGLGRYISPDSQIDASTGLFPETTWYIKNANHKWTESIHVLVLSMIRQHITVSSGSYSQFLVYHETDNGYGRLDTLQAVNDNDVEWKTTLSDAEEGEATTTLISVLNKWIQLFIKFINSIIAVFVNFGSTL